MVAVRGHDPPVCGLWPSLGRAQISAQSPRIFLYVGVCMQHVSPWDPSRDPCWLRWELSPPRHRPRLAPRSMPMATHKRSSRRPRPRPLRSRISRLVSISSRTTPCRGRQIGRVGNYKGTTYIANEVKKLGTAAGWRQRDVLPGAAVPHAQVHEQLASHH
jgi:hypothetical protein